MADDILGTAGDIIDPAEISEFSDTYIKNELSLDYIPTPIDRTRLGGNIQIEDLCRVIGELLKYLETKTLVLPTGEVMPIIPPDWRVYYTPAYPDELLKNTSGVRVPDSPQEKATNIVCYKLTKYMSASIDHQPFSGRRPSKKRIRENYPSEVTGEYYQLASKWYDALIQFDCFAKSNREVEDLTRNMENTLEFYERLFLELGVQRWCYWDRVIDGGAEALAQNNRMNVRSFQMYARVEKFYAVPTVAISKIITEFQVMVGRLPTDWNNS